MKTLYQTKDEQTVFLIRNFEGSYLAKNCSLEHDDHYDFAWTTLQWAKVYDTARSANTQITKWAAKFPEHGIPELVPAKLKIGKPIDQTERVFKVWLKKGILDEKAKGIYEMFLKADVVYLDDVLFKDLPNDEETGEIQIGAFNSVRVVSWDSVMKVLKLKTNE